MLAIDKTCAQSSINLLDLSPDEVSELGRGLGWPRYRSGQLLRWIYRQRVRAIEQMTDLSKAARLQLEAMATVERFRQPLRQHSPDGTTKYLFQVAGGSQIESVLIPEGRRLTLCLSTQVGCTLDCQFCLTGRMGLIRNLKASEIVDQVLSVQDDLGPGQRLSNLVFMGMGEPLANLDAVRDALARITNPSWGLGFSPRRITLSTAGLASKLPEVAGLGINIAVSLNATTDDQRNRLMPTINRLHPLPALMQACRAYPLPVRRRLTFEYVLMAGVNDSDQDARRLGKLLNGMRCKVNLIPFNEFPDSPFKRPSDEAVLRFQNLVKQADLDVFIRKSMGRDVLGACGQLGSTSQQAIPVMINS